MPWADRAACAGQDVTLFYPAGKADGDDYRRGVERARAICHPCPVAWDCLRWALNSREPWGIWGGADAVGRDALLKALRERRAAAEAAAA